jgi:hypothetical protein
LQLLPFTLSWLGRVYQGILCYTKWSRTELKS